MFKSFKEILCCVVLLCYPVAVCHKMCVWDNDDYLYLALREVLQEVILHDCLLDDGAGPEVLVVLGDGDVPGDRHTLARHGMLLHQGGGGQRSAGLLKKDFAIFLDMSETNFIILKFLQKDIFLRS